MNAASTPYVSVRPDARPLVPDPNRAIPAPQVAAVVSAAPGGELIAESAADARIHSRPATIDKIGKLFGARNPGRAGLAPRRAPGNQDHQSSVRTQSPGLLRSDMYHVFARAYPKPPIGQTRTIVTRYHDVPLHIAGNILG
jgi:hypothetical protein